MFWLLDLVYLGTLVGAIPWLIWGCVRQGKYREGFGEKLLGRVPVRPSSSRCAWFHAVSVGEVNLLQPLLQRFQADFPGWDCVISTTTKTGFELARKKFSGHCVFYCPLDFSWGVSEALRRVRPDLLVLAELELWPNLIRLAKRQGCRVAMVNGRLSQRSFRGYRRLRWLFAPILRQVDLIAAQNADDASRFQHLLGSESGNRLHVTGSVKFDGTLTNRNHPQTTRLRELAGILSDEIVFLAGSTQEPEEELAVQAFQACFPQYPQLRLIIAPRHITRCQDVCRMLDRYGIPWQRRTTLERQGADARARILLVDTIGELGAWWGTAQIAFVGGSMGSRGGQNMIEPAGFGTAISFGPHTSNFRDVVRLLLESQGAVVVHDGHEITRFVRRCLEDSSWAHQMGQRAQALVLSQQGATERTMRLLQKLMDAVPAPGVHRAA